MAALSKKTLSISLKIAIVLLAFWFIIRKVGHNADLGNFLSLIRKLDILTVVAILGFVFLLMFLNWGIEVMKWQRLLNGIENISFYKGVESVFCGLTIAIFTPSRIGEFGGRVFFLSPRKRVIGIVVMAVGNIGQMVLTNVFGAIAACIFIYRFVPLDFRLFYLIVFVAALFCLFLLIFYFNINWVRGILLSFKFTRKYQKFYNVLTRYKKKELFKLLVLCFSRYAVFTTQYFILLQWLIPGLHYLDVIMMLCIVFLIQSSLPSLDIFDIGIRSLTATYFFGFITDNNLAVIASTACIWLMNIIIPAILGTYFVFKLKFFGSSRST